MIVTPERNIQQILRKHSSQTAKLLSHLQLIERINRHVNSALPSELVEKVRIQHYQKGTLTLACDSAHWLHLLKFALPDLLSALRQQGLPGLISIKTVVEPLKTSKPNASDQLVNVVRESNEPAASSIEAGLENITDHELKSALEQLANHLRAPQSKG